MAAYRFESSAYIRCVGCSFSKFDGDMYYCHCLNGGVTVSKEGASQPCRVCHKQYYFCNCCTPRTTESRTREGNGMLDLGIKYYESATFQKELQKVLPEPWGRWTPPEDYIVHICDDILCVNCSHARTHPTLD